MIIFASVCEPGPQNQMLWPLGVTCNKKKKRSIMTVTSVPWRGNKRCVDFYAFGEFWAFGLFVMSWSTCKINPGLMGRQSRWHHEPGIYKACPNEAVSSLKSEQVIYRHEGDMAGDATFVPSSGNRDYSSNRTFPFRWISVASIFHALGEC